jgi:N-methylhydantoinase A
MIRIGIDTGGTFTDFVFFDGEETTPLKLPSTPENPALAILEGIKPYIDSGEDFELIHGTTVSTNSFIQKKMAKSAFICTRGFEHLLYIGRQNRTELFSLKVQKPYPIVPLDLCFGIDERTLKDGTISREPHSDEILSLCEKLKKEDVQAVGILFLHSYRNPVNERKVAALMREAGFYVTASHEIMPEYREYERAVVTMLNSTLKPVIADYVKNLETALAGKKLSIIQSNGGILSPEQIIKEPIRTIISGPAGGVIAAKKVGRLTGDLNLITLDMGGTSTDVSVIKDGKLTLTRDGSVEHLPLRIPMIDIATVGAGGGSIARVDRGGVLRVGPDSAGADPGPACYGNAELATVTDAFVVTGAIIPEMFLGGKKKIHPKKSVKYIKEIAYTIGKDLYETAEGIIRISVSNMERALRSVTLERGEDPRRYTLMPFGGAGGLVAAMLAERLRIKRILIPPNPGVFSAMGMLEANFKKELTASFLKTYNPNIIHPLNMAFAKLSTKAEQIMVEEGFPAPEIKEYVDIRYKGQSYELTVPYKDDFIQRFHSRHEQLYSYFLDDSNCEIVNLRVLAKGVTPGLKIVKKALVQEDAKALFTKQVFFNGESHNFDIYRRGDLQPGFRVKVPAIVVSEDATVIVPGNFKAEVDEYFNLILDAVEK